jgi:hypothetical protein
LPPNKPRPHPNSRPDSCHPSAVIPAQAEIHLDLDLDLDLVLDQFLIWLYLRARAFRALRESLFFERQRKVTKRKPP